MNTLRHFITHGSEHAMTTRWHRVKCKVRWKWYMVIKPPIRDWWNNETYVPLHCRNRNEIRSYRVSAIQPSIEASRFRATDWNGLMMSMSLPPGVERFEDLPQFKKSDACCKYAADEWPQLQA